MNEVSGLLSLLSPTPPLSIVARVLYSLGDFGFMKYKAPLVAHFQQEIQEHDLLPVCKDAVKGWASLVDSKESRYLHSLFLFFVYRFPLSYK